MTLTDLERRMEALEEFVGLRPSMRPKPAPPQPEAQEPISAEHWIEGAADYLDGLANDEASLYATWLRNSLATLAPQAGGDGVPVEELRTIWRYRMINGAQGPDEVALAYTVLGDWLAGRKR